MGRGRGQKDLAVGQGLGGLLKGRDGRLRQPGWEGESEEENRA